MTVRHTETQAMCIFGGQGDFWNLVGPGQLKGINIKPIKPAGCRHRHVESKNFTGWEKPGKGNKDDFFLALKITE